MYKALFFTVLFYRYDIMNLIMFLIYYKRKGESGLFRRDISAGGVVLYKKSILLLKKFNGKFVLPKGRIEDGESRDVTAIREVEEESGIKGEIIAYLGEINYTFKDARNNGDFVHKTVHWFLMNALNKEPYPQKEEGFSEAMFVPYLKALKIIEHRDEASILNCAIKRIEANF